MSETEFGRLMDEVTAAPPVDVRFDAIADRVRRRHSRLRASAAVAAVVALAVIITVPAALESGRSHGVASRPAPLPSAAIVVDPSWVGQSWGAFHWRQPAEWKVVDTGLDKGRRLDNNNIPGPFIGTQTPPAACPSPTANGPACSVRPSPPLPEDGVIIELVGKLSLGGSGGLRPTSLPAADPGTVAPPDATCRAWGGAKSFTATRFFGPPDSPHEAQLVGCLGSAVVESASHDLRIVLATMTDTDFNSIPTGPSHRVTNGNLSWLLPSTWSTVGAAGARHFAIDCPADDPKPGRGEGCGQPDGAAQLPGGGAFAWISGVYASGLPTDMNPTKKYADAPFGQSIPMTPDCKAIGGTQLFVVQRHLGPVGGGEFVTVAGCLTDKDSASQESELRGILNSMSDAQYPSAKDICSSVPAKVEAAALDTVGDLRILRWGTTQPARDVFPDAKADAFAAWCWVRDDSHQQFVVYAAHKGDPAVKVVDVHAPTYWGTNPAPSAAPTSLIDSANYHTSSAPPLGNLTTTTATISSSTNGPTAEALCTSTLGKVASAEASTVLQIRTATWGPQLAHAKGNLANAFPRAKGTDFAAWCWTGVPGSWYAYAVHAGDAPVDAGHEDQVGGNVDPSEAPPSGQPLFP